MGQKDLAQNDYFNDKVRFADVCNGVLFHGEAVIKPEELQESVSDIVYKEEVGKRRKIIPDKVWTWKGTHIAILTVENQTKIDYSMLFRVMKEETARTICDIAGINSKWIKTIKSESMEVVDMCKAWDDRKEEGKEEGREEGREAGICAAVKMCRNMKVSVQDAVEQLAKAFALTKEISEQKVNLYWE